MNILVIHQFYLEHGDAGGSRFNDFCRAWANAGHSVTVIASQVHYSTGRRSPGRSWLRTQRDGPVQVFRVRSAEHSKSRRWRRVLSFSGFGAAASAALSKIEKPDIVLASSPSLPVALPGMLAKAKFHVPFVFEVRDLWPESAVTTGVIEPTHTLTKAAYALEELAYETADHIVALTPGIAERIEEAHGHKHISVIPNGIDPLALPRDIRREEIRKRYGWEDKHVILYTGAHGIANDLSQFIAAADRLRDKEKFLFVALGDGPERHKLIETSKKKRLTNMQWLPAVGRDQLYHFIAAADRGAILLQKNPTFLTVYPNKLFDYLAMGLPTICAVDGNARALLERAQGGVFVEPENTDAFCDAVVNFPDAACDLDFASAFIRSEFDRRVQAKDYLSMMLRLVS